MDLTADSRGAAAGWSLLTQLPSGRCGTVRDVLADGNGATDRLKAMGICAGRKVMVVRSGDPLILRVLGSRIGVSARLASRIRVEPCTSDLCDGGFR